MPLGKKAARQLAGRLFHSEKASSALASAVPKWSLILELDYNSDNESGLNAHKYMKIVLVVNEIRSIPQALK